MNARLPKVKENAPFRFQIEIIRFDPQVNRVELTFNNSAETIAAIGEVSDETVLIAVTQYRYGYCLGDFTVWRSAGRTFVRRGEHRSHEARQKLHSAEPVGVVVFRDDDGSHFEMPFADTVSAQVAASELNHWIITGEVTDELLWS